MSNTPAALNPQRDTAAHDSSGALVCVRVTFLSWSGLSCLTAASVDLVPESELHPQVDDSGLLKLCARLCALLGVSPQCLH